MAKMVDLFEADAEHKAQIRERLKGQDKAMTALIEQQNRIERLLTDRRLPRRPEAGG